MDKNITIIANCQAWPLAQVAACIGRNVTVRFVSLNDVMVEGSFSNNSAKRLIEEAADSDELVYAFNAARPTFSPIDTETLRDVFGDRLKTFTNIRFDGLHPDSTYFGGFGGRTTATMGEYHSKLIMYAYSTGRSQKDCLSLFNANNYESVGYFDLWDASADYLRERDDACDIKLADMFLDIARSEYALYSFNHPTSAVLHDVAQALLTDAQVPVASIGRHHFANALFQNFIWPVYPEVAEYHRLPYSGSYHFSKMMNGDSDVFYSRPIDLEEIIARDYEIYKEQASPDEFRAIVQTLDFYPQMQDALG